MSKQQTKKDIPLDLRLNQYQKDSQRPKKAGVFKRKINKDIGTEIKDDSFLKTNPKSDSKTDTAPANTDTKEE